MVLEESRFQLLCGCKSNLQERRKWNTLASVESQSCLAAAQGKLWQGDEGLAYPWLQMSKHGIFACQMRLVLSVLHLSPNQGCELGSWPLHLGLLGTMSCIYHCGHWYSNACFLTASGVSASTYEPLLLYSHIRSSLYFFTDIFPTLSVNICSVHTVSLEAILW